MSLMCDSEMQVTGVLEMSTRIVPALRELSDFKIPRGMYAQQHTSWKLTTNYHASVHTEEEAIITGLSVLLLYVFLVFVIYKVAQNWTSQTLHSPYWRQNPSGEIFQDHFRKKNSWEYIISPDKDVDSSFTVLKESLEPERKCNRQESKVLSGSLGEHHICVWFWD